MHQITLFQDKKSKNFLGTGNSPLPRPYPQWGGEGGHPLPTFHPARRLRRLDPRAYGAWYPLLRKSWIRHCVGSQLRRRPGNQLLLVQYPSTCSASSCTQRQSTAYPWRVEILNRQHLRASLSPRRLNQKLQRHYRLINFSRVPRQYISIFQITRPKRAPLAGFKRVASQQACERCVKTQSSS